MKKRFACVKFSLAQHYGMITHKRQHSYSIHSNKLTQKMALR